MQDPTPRSITHGLIRFLPYADYPNATYNYYADAYCCVGLEAATRALRAIAETEAADEIAREAAAYRADILKSMDAAVLAHDGRPVLPLEPDTHRILDAGGGGAGGYYGLVASMLLETGLLDDHRHADCLRSFLEEGDGLTMGMCQFDEGIDHAYTFGYWRDCLRRGAIDRVLLGFYGSLAYGMGRDTYCGVEVTQILTGESTPTTPHLYSSTQQLRLLRLMLLRDEGDTVHIGEAIPHGWLATGQRVVVRDAPTAHGPFSFAYEAMPDRLVVTLQLPCRWPPVRFRVHLRSLQRICEVRRDGVPIDAPTDGYLDLYVPTRQVRLEAIFAQ